MKLVIKKLVTVAILTVVLCSGCGKTTETDRAATTEETSKEEVRIKKLQMGDKAPDFSATLVNGETFKLSDYCDGVVRLNFWATWCPPCVGEMPAFEKLNNESLEGLQIICVNCMEDKATVDKFVKDNGYTFNIGYDENGAIEAYYPTDGIPYTLVINKGEISKIYVGAYDADKQYEEYKDAIEECFGK